MPNKEYIKDWYIFDAKDQTLGRLSTKIADLLRGKGKANFAPNVDNGDIVVVINAKKVKLTGKKEDQKRYYSHSAYLGNLRTITLSELRISKPENIIKHAVAGMLPKNTLAKSFLSHLKVYADENHPHTSVKFKNQG
jgi:large subunit ribosomal protein L13